jgi:hypothetical protein
MENKLIADQPKAPSHAIEQKEHPFLGQSLQKLQISSGQEGEKGHPRTSLITHQQKLAKAQ